MLSQSQDVSTLVVGWFGKSSLYAVPLRFLPVSPHPKFFKESLMLLYRKIRPFSSNREVYKKELVTNALV